MRFVIRSRLDYKVDIDGNSLIYGELVVLVRKVEVRLKLIYFKEREFREVDGLKGKFKFVFFFYKVKNF